jgi:cytochrome c-type biogenesis protein CcmH
MVLRLAERLQAHPEDAEGWVMLARSYGALREYDHAASAYANASARLPGDAAVLIDYADMLAMAQGKSLQGEPEALIARALKIEPGNVKALAMAGTAAFQRQDYAKAITYWERALGAVPPDSRAARSLQGSLAEARALLSRVATR